MGGEWLEGLKSERLDGRARSVLEGESEQKVFFYSLPARLLNSCGWDSAGCIICLWLVVCCITSVALLAIHLCTIWTFTSHSDPHLVNDTSGTISLGY